MWTDDRQAHPVHYHLGDSVEYGLHGASDASSSWWSIFDVRFQAIRFLAWLSNTQSTTIVATVLALTLVCVLATLWYLPRAMRHRRLRMARHAAGCRHCDRCARALHGAHMCAHDDCIRRRNEVAGEFTHARKAQ
jgi:hypothetical protein